MSNQYWRGLRKIVLTEVLVFKTEISQSSVHQIFKQYKHNPCKSTHKPGLIEKMKQERARFLWCLAHKNYGIEYFKNVIFADETGAVVGHQHRAVRCYGSAPRQWLRRKRRGNTADM